MTVTAIFCRCGQKLKLHADGAAIAKCPSCGRKIDFIAADVPAKGLSRKSYKRLFKEHAREEEEETTTSEAKAVASELFSAFSQFLVANLFWVVSTSCIAGMLIVCLYFVAQTIEPSEAQLNYEMAVEMRGEGRVQDARTLLEQIIEQSPKSRWARDAQGMLAEMPTVPSNRSTTLAEVNDLPE